MLGMFCFDFFICGVVAWQNYVHVAFWAVRVVLFFPRFSEGEWSKLHV